MRVVTEEEEGVRGEEGAKRMRKRVMTRRIKDGH
jgi:hypothetical protein